MPSHYNNVLNSTFFGRRKAPMLSAAAREALNLPTGEPTVPGLDSKLRNTQTTMFPRRIGGTIITPPPIETVLSPGFGLSRGFGGEDPAEPKGFRRSWAPPPIETVLSRGFGNRTPEEVFIESGEWPEGFRRRQSLIEQYEDLSDRDFKADFDTTEDTPEGQVDPNINLPEYYGELDRNELIQKTKTKIDQFIATGEKNTWGGTINSQALIQMEILARLGQLPVEYIHYMDFAIQEMIASGVPEEAPLSVDYANDAQGIQEFKDAFDRWAERKPVDDRAVEAAEIVRDRILGVFRNTLLGESVAMTAYESKLIGSLLDMTEDQKSEMRAGAMPPERITALLLRALDKVEAKENRERLETDRDKFARGLDPIFKNFSKFDDFRWSSDSFVRLESSTREQILQDFFRRREIRQSMDTRKNAFKDFTGEGGLFPEYEAENLAALSPESFQILLKQRLGTRQRGRAQEPFASFFPQHPTGTLGAVDPQVFASMLRNYYEKQGNIRYGEALKGLLPNLNMSAAQLGEIPKDIAMTLVNRQQRGPFTAPRGFLRPVSQPSVRV